MKRFASDERIRKRLQDATKEGSRVVVSACVFVHQDEVDESVVRPDTVPNPLVLMQESRELSPVLLANRRDDRTFLHGLEGCPGVIDRERGARFFCSHCEVHEPEIGTDPVLFHDTRESGFESAHDPRLQNTHAGPGRDGPLHLIDERGDMLLDDPVDKKRGSAMGSEKPDQAGGGSRVVVAVIPEGRPPGGAVDVFGEFALGVIAEQLLSQTDSEQASPELEMRADESPVLDLVGSQTAQIDRNDELLLIRAQPFEQPVPAGPVRGFDPLLNRARDELADHVEEVRVVIAPRDQLLAGVIRDERMRGDGSLGVPDPGARRVDGEVASLGDGYQPNIREVFAFHDLGDRFADQPVDILPGSPRIFKCLERIFHRKCILFLLMLSFKIRSGITYFVNASHGHSSSLALSFQNYARFLFRVCFLLDGACGIGGWMRFCV